MKKIIFILILSATIFNKVDAQTTPVTDTLAYLHTIVNNKASFIGHPFSTLANNLQIQIKFFSPFASLPYDKTKETSTSFAFYFPQDGTDDFYLIYPCLEIYWQTPLNATQSDIIWTNNNGGGWNAAATSFYSTGIISDIKIRE